MLTCRLFYAQINERGGGERIIVVLHVSINCGSTDMVCSFTIDKQQLALTGTFSGDC